MFYKIQPAPYVDHITDDGAQLWKTPYPVVADQGGMVPDSALGIRRVVGFVRDLATQQVDMLWSVATQRPFDVPGMYAVVCGAEGQFYTLTTAVDSFTTLPQEQPAPSLDRAAYRLGVHATHCCKRHGCKYGDWQCPVKSGEAAQEFPCEQCPEPESDGATIAAMTSDEVLHELREAVSAQQNGDGPNRLTQLFDELDYRMTELGGSGTPSDWR